MATTATSWWRRRWSRETPTEVLPDVPAPVDVTGIHAERDELWRLLQELPIKQRAVVVLRFYEDLSEAEVANALGISPGDAPHGGGAARRWSRVRR